jgi:hypothetical protein
MPVAMARVELPTRANAIRGYRVLILRREPGVKSGTEHFRWFLSLAKNLSGSVFLEARLAVVSTDLLRLASLQLR